MVAVSNGLTVDDHAMIQESVGNRYPVTVSFSIATGRTPASALETATEQLQDAGSAQDESRREILRGRAIEPEYRTDGDLQMAHFDINEVTERYTDQVNAFDAFIHIEQGYAALMKHLREAYGALAFFVGGDNIIAVCPDLEPGDYRDAVEHVQSTADVALKVGVGEGATAGEAGMGAKHALEECRANGTVVEFADDH
jgi:GTP cyclohydrolase IIa